MSNMVLHFSALVLESIAEQLSTKSQETNTLDSLALCFAQVDLDLCSAYVYRLAFSKAYINESVLFKPNT